MVEKKEEFNNEKILKAEDEIMSLAEEMRSFKETSTQIEEARSSMQQMITETKETQKKIEILINDHKSSNKKVWVVLKILLGGVGISLILNLINFYFNLR